MISGDELNDWVEKFDVPDSQIRRDHLISHVLVAIEKEGDEKTKFYGGTALCRSCLLNVRLSEDIDLLHPEPRERLEFLKGALPKAMRKEFPDASWSDLPSEGDGFASQLRADGVDGIRLDVGRLGPERRAWEFEPGDIALRYSDVPDVVRLACPTLPTFVAMKYEAWCDRHAPRDLFDLAGLAEIGAFDLEANRILREATGRSFLSVDLGRVPRATADAWETELGSQVRDTRSAQGCLEVVKRAVEELGGRV